METEIYSLIKQIDFYKVQQVYEEYAIWMDGGNEPPTKESAVYSILDTLTPHNTNFDTIYSLLGKTKWGYNFLVTYMKKYDVYQTNENFEKVINWLWDSSKYNNNIRAYCYLIKSCKKYHTQYYFEYGLVRTIDRKQIPNYISRLISDVEEFRTDENFDKVLCYCDYGVIEHFYRKYNTFREYVDKNYPNNSYRYGSQVL